MTKRPEVIDLALAGNLHLLEKAISLPPAFQNAACIKVDPDLFFAKSPRKVALAKSICAACPIRTKCLNWALENEEYGIFGGTTPEERKYMLAGVAPIDDSKLRKMQEQLALILSPDINRAIATFNVNKRTIYRWRDLLQSGQQQAF